MSAYRAKAQQDDHDAGAQCVCAVCDAAAARAARLRADKETLFERVRRLVVDHGIRDDENGELFADRLDDVLRSALDGGQ